MVRTSRCPGDLSWGRYVNRSFLTVMMQLWVEVMSIYADQRAKIEGQVKMFSDPTSEKLLPDQPPQYRSTTLSLPIPFPRTSAAHALLLASC